MVVRASHHTYVLVVLDTKVHGVNHVSANIHTTRTHGS